MNDKERMQIIAENITYYRKLKGLTQKELSKEIGIRASTMTDYMKLRTAPSFGVIQKLADFFGVNKSDIDTTFKTVVEKNDILQIYNELHPPRQEKVLTFANEQYSEQKNEQNSEIIKLFEYDYYDSPASAGTGQYLSDVEKEKISLPVDVKADFVIPVYGDSMEPDYHTGDYVFVKLSVDLADGDIGVFEYYGDAYIKQLVIDDEGAYLHSLNTKYKDIAIDADSDFRIIGEVVEIYREN